MTAIHGGKIRILIADDSESVRRAIRDLLNDHSSGWVICGESDNGEDAVREVAKLLPDVILLDVSLPMLNGVAVARIVRTDHPAVMVVMLSAQDSSVLSLVAHAAGTPHFVTKSLLAINLIPFLTSLVKDHRNP